MIINFDKGDSQSSLVRAYQGHMGDTINPDTGEITEGTGHIALCYVYKTSDGKYTLVKVDIEDVVKANDFKEGLQLSGRAVSVKIDNASESFLSVSMSGVSINGVQSAITSAVTIERERAISAETMILSALSAETQNRISGDSALTIALEEEKNRAISAETRLEVYSSANTMLLDKAASGTNIEVNIDNLTIGKAADGKLSALLKIVSATPSSVNVYQEYALVDNEGNDKGEHIKIYKDTSLKQVYIGHMDDTIDPATGVITSGTGNTALCFKYQLADDTYSLVKIDIEEFLSEAEFKDGLFVSGHNVYVKIDPTSEAYLSVSPNGVKLSGVTEIAEVLSAETNARIEADTMILSALSAETQNRIEGDSALTIALEEETVARISADTIISSALSVETQNRISGDTFILSALSAETQNRLSADSALTKTIIDNEKVTAAAINNLQNKFSAYTPTSGMSTINGNPITVGGNIVIGGGSGSNVVELTQAQYDALSAYTPNTTYIITDANEVNIADYFNSAQTNTAIANAVGAESARSESVYFKKAAISAYTPTSGFTTINGSAITTGGNMTIIGEKDSVTSTGSSIVVSSSKTGNDVNYNVEANIDNKSIDKDGNNKIRARVGLKYTDLGDNRWALQITDVDGTPLASNGVVVPDWDHYLDNYYTSAQTEDKISRAVSAETVARVAADAAESARTESTYQKKSAMSAYYTSAQTDTKISAAVGAESARCETVYQKKASMSAYYTSAQTNTAIANAVGSESARSESAYVKSAWTESQYMKKATSGATEGNVLLSNNNVGQPLMSSYKFRFLTQAAYDALATKDNNTIYFIVS